MPSPTRLVVPIRTARTIDADAPLDLGAETIDRDFTSHVLDPHDLQALTLALALRDAGAGAGAVEVSAIGLMEPARAPLLRHAVALGADRTLAVWDARMRAGGAPAAATALADQLPEAPLLLTGDPALGGALAMRLGLGALVGCVGASWDEDGEGLAVERVLPDGGSELLRTDPEIVLVVDATAPPAALPDFAAARSAEEVTIESHSPAAGTSFEAEPPLPIRLHRAPPREPRLITDDVELGAAALADLIRDASGTGT
jgi:electron transfer flavoprotein alpha/beta subunit